MKSIPEWGQAVNQARRVKLELMNFLNDHPDSELALVAQQALRETDAFLQGQGQR